jgi:hypothetical protein
MKKLGILFLFALFFVACSQDPIEVPLSAQQSELQTRASDEGATHYYWDTTA